MKRLFLLTIYLILFIPITVESNVIIAGKVIDCKTNQPIAKAHVISIHSNIVSITDSAGLFKMMLEKGDSVSIQSIGYENTKFHISKIDDTLYFHLYPKVYSIDEVQVGILGSYDQFKKSFLLNGNNNTFRIPGMKEPKVRPIPILEDEIYWNDPKKIFVSPISYFYFKYSKHAKSVFKYHELEKQRNEQLRVDDKYNKQFIQDITGLTNEKEIENFMLFCNFSHDFIMCNTQFKLGELIKEKYKIYTQMEKH